MHYSEELTFINRMKEQHRQRNVDINRNQRYAGNNTVLTIARSMHLQQRN